MYAMYELNHKAMIAGGLWAIDLTTNKRYEVAAPVVAAAKEALAYSEELANFSLAEHFEYGMLYALAEEVGHELTTYCPAELLKEFFGARYALHALRDRAARRRQKHDRRGLDAHRNGGWGYLLVE